MPDSFSSDFRLPAIPDHLTLPQFMLDYGMPNTASDTWPERSDASIIDDETGEQFCFDMLKSRTQNLSNGIFIQYQLSSNDIVMIMSPNHNDYPVAIWAVQRLGGIVTFANPQSTAQEVEYQMRIAGVTFLVAHSSVLGTAMQAAAGAGLGPTRLALLDRLNWQGQTKLRTVEELIQLGSGNTQVAELRLAPGEAKKRIAFLCWSSGTTGKPKAVAISHHAFISNIVAVAVHGEMNKPVPLRKSTVYRPGDTALAALPFYHVAGLVIHVHLNLFCGRSIVIIPKYNIHSMMQSMQRHEASHILLVPPQALAMTKYASQFQFDGSRVRSISIGAAPLSRDVEGTMRIIFPNAAIGQIYGMTEMTAGVAISDFRRPKAPLGSAGRLLPGMHARVQRRDGTQASYGEKGELMVQGPSMALGYYKNSKATADTFQNGWVRTGDEVMITRDGDIFVYDRLKEIIKVRGFQVAPAELEECLLTHGDVEDACVVGVQDDYSGECPAAYVVLSEVASEIIHREPHKTEMVATRIARHVASRKVAYKHLEGGIHFVPTIPRNGSGKILRRILRDQARRDSRSGRFDIRYQEKARL